MTSPTIQPSRPAPAQTKIGKRSSSAMISAAPATMSGMLMPRPMTSSAMLPPAAAAIAITLSRLMMMSATATMRTARQRCSVASDRNADAEADDEQRHVAARGCRDRDHVVEAHDDVGDRNDAHRPPEMLGGLRLVLVGVLGHEHLDRDVEQRDAADDLEPRQRHQRSDETGEHNAQEHRHADADHHPPDPLTRRQRAASHRDDDRVVARQ